MEGETEQRSSRTATSGDAREAENLHVMPMVRMPMIALAIVALLSILSIALTLIVWSRTIERTAVVQNAIRSLRVTGDLRDAAARLAVATPSTHTAREAQLIRDMQRFEPLVTEAEAVEWGNLRRELDRVVESPADSPEHAVWIDHFSESLDRLGEINERAAQLATTRIENAQEFGMIFEIGREVVVVLVTAALALVLVRVLRRQRRLIQRDLASLYERNRELGAFAARTAHDLRGPLAPIAGYAELVAAGAPVEATRAASKIRSAAHNMSAIIENLLALSAVGRLPVGHVEPRSVVASVVDELHAELADAKVTVDVADDEVACAPNVLGQLLRNLLSNAAKYRAPSRPLEVAISGRASDRWFELSITDNGVGMDRDAVAHVFEERYRVIDTATLPGHGLGLAIVKRTVDALGGSCTLTSEPDVGTRVVLRLPRLVADTAR